MKKGRTILLAKKIHHNKLNSLLRANKHKLISPIIVTSMTMRQNELGTE